MKYFLKNGKAETFLPERAAVSLRTVIEIIGMVALHGIRGGGVMGEIAHAGALLYERPIRQPHAEQLQPSTSASSAAAASRGTSTRVVAIAGVTMGARPCHSV